MKNNKLLPILGGVLGVAAILVFFLTRGVPGNTPAAEKLPLLQAAQKAIPGLDSMTDYDGDEFFDIVGVSPDEYTEFLYRTGENEKGLVAREALIVRARDAEAAKRVLEVFNHYHAQRETETRSYAPDIYQMLEKSSVSLKNNTVALLISENSAAETAAFLAGE